jgi:large subunit ribosomal protein L10
VADIAGLDATQTSKLRRMAFQKGVKLSVVKNTLLKKAMENSEKNFDDLYGTLVGNTSILLSDTGNVPAKLIKDIRKKQDKPLLKGAYIEEAIYVGDDKLDALTAIKSKEELIGDIITLLQSPAKNVVSALQSGGNTLSGLLKAIEERNN